MKSLKISIVTISFNNENDIRSTIESVVGQTYDNIEYIIVDGGSTDDTINIVNEYINSISIVISEPDNGMYDAINKGIKISTGDIVGLIHAGDRLFNNQVIAKIAQHFEHNNIDAMYGHSKIVNSRNEVKLINISPQYSKKMIRRGWMPSHQSIYIRREVFDKLGYYRNDLGGSGDYEFFVRYFYFNEIKVKLLKEYIIYFTLGGRSTNSLKKKLQSQAVHKECWRINGGKPPMFLIPLKMSRKFMQILRGKLDTSS